MVAAWLLEVVHVVVACFWKCRRDRLVKLCCWVFDLVDYILIYM